MFVIMGYKASDLTVTVDKGSISGENGEYIIMPTKPGILTVSVNFNDKLIQKTEFLAKEIPNPIAKVMGQSSGLINKFMLANAPMVYAELEDFEFDLKFEITQFNMVVSGDNFVSDDKLAKRYISKSKKFTPQQTEAIINAEKGSRVVIDNIEAEGSDGQIRKLSPMVFTLK